MAPRMHWIFPFVYALGTWFFCRCFLCPWWYESFFCYFLFGPLFRSSLHSPFGTSVISLEYAVGLLNIVYDLSVLAHNYFWYLLVCGIAQIMNMNFTISTKIIWSWTAVRNLVSTFICMRSTWKPLMGGSLFELNLTAPKTWQPFSVYLVTFLGLYLARSHGFMFDHSVVNDEQDCTRWNSMGWQKLVNPTQVNYLQPPFCLSTVGRQSAFE